jgi:hypothetical protein
MTEKESDVNGIDTEAARKLEAAREAPVVQLHRGRYRLKKDPESPTYEFREFLARLCNVTELVKVRQFGDPGDRWQLVFLIDGLERAVDLTLDDLCTPKDFKAKVGRVSRRTPRPRHGGMDDVLDAVLEAADSDIGEVVDSGLSRDEETRGWLSAMLGSSAMDVGLCDPTDSGDLYDVLGDSAASFVDPSERVYLRLGGVVRFVSREYGQRTSHRDVADRLGALGFERAQLTARKPGAGRGGAVRKARFWVAPPDFDLDA